MSTLSPSAGIRKVTPLPDASWQRAALPAVIGDDHSLRVAAIRASVRAIDDSDEDVTFDICRDEEEPVQRKLPVTVAAPSSSAADADEDSDDAKDKNWRSPNVRKRAKMLDGVSGSPILAPGASAPGTWRAANIIVFNETTGDIAVTSFPSVMSAVKHLFTTVGSTRCTNAAHLTALVHQTLRNKSGVYRHAMRPEDDGAVQRVFVTYASIAPPRTAAAAASLWKEGKGKNVQ